MIATLYLFEITLTLPGIAGIILSIGMAVDANVIIFARIREEIADGKSVATAIETGFARARVSDLRWKYYNIDRSSSSWTSRFRYRKRICFYISDRYYPFNVYLYGSYEGADAAFYVWIGTDAKFYGKAKERKPFDFVGKTGIFIAIPVRLSCVAV